MSIYVLTLASRLAPSIIDIDTGGNITVGVSDTGGHIFPEIYIDLECGIGGKFAACVNDPGGKIWSE